jgi:hypothetical protein
VFRDQKFAEDEHFYPWCVVLAKVKKSDNLREGQGEECHGKWGGIRDLIFPLPEARFNVGRMPFKTGH